MNPGRGLAVATAVLVIGGCVHDTERRARPDTGAESPRSSPGTDAAALASRPDLPVTAEWPADRSYETLGWIEWPPKDMFMLFSVSCGPEKLREAATEKWGARVDAIVGYEEWQAPPVQLRCGGAAIRFQ